MPSNYALYIKEREGMDIIEDEKGFATYQLSPALRAAYIQDIFVRKEFRKEGIASAYADQITKIAKDNGLTTLIGSVDPRANGADASDKVLKAYGMTRRGEAANGLVYYSKEIK